jgi:hypothetical protein
MRKSVVTITLVIASTGAAGAQSPKPAVPADMVPPPGMCRIWIRDLPPKQQPAPTACAEAIRKKPANSDVIYGDDYAKRGPSRGVIAPPAPPSRPGGPPATASPPVPPTPPVVKKPGGGGN